MTSAATLRLIALAVAGILVAAGVAVLASNLASRQIGLASEPISAGDQLAAPLARPQHEGGSDGKGRNSGEGGGSSRESSGGTSTPNGEAAGESSPTPESPTGEGTSADDSGETGEPGAAGGEPGAGKGDD
jgi:hypothetical protein